MPRYTGDPRWILTRYAGKCDTCGAVIPKATTAFYYPTTKTILGKACGHADKASAEFESHAFDESMLTGQW